jgi:signal peptidase II
MRFGLLLTSAALVLVIDYASKRIVMSWFHGGQYDSRHLGPRIRLVINARIGLGLIRDRRTLLSLWSGTVLGTFLLIYASPVLQSPSAQIALGAALGGATGNLLNSFGAGAIVDFIDLRIWPVFNIADTAIVLGTTGMLWCMR